jgi:hypothetical protein
MVNAFFDYREIRRVHDTDREGKLSGISNPGIYA